MKQVNDKEAFDLLYREGFTEAEINRLIQLRQHYTTNKLKQTHRRNPLLRFGQWCMRIMLTDEVWYALSHWSSAEKQEV